VTAASSRPATGRPPSLAIASAASSLLAAATFALVPVVGLIPHAVGPGRSALFLLGAAAFASNLLRGRHPAIRAASALVQSVCVFQALGFLVGLSLTVHADTIRWQVTDLRAWRLAWGLLVAASAALALEAFDLRPRSAPAGGSPPADAQAPDSPASPPSV
jgi:hypothetical protein